MNIEQLLKGEGKFSFDVNEWGSCQYSGALAMYKAYFKLREKYDRQPGPYSLNNLRYDNNKEKNSSILDYLKETYSYQITFSGIRDNENAIEEFFKIIAIRRKWNFNLWDCRESEQWIKLNEHDKKTINLIRRAQSGDDLFFIGRAIASDLWNTAPRVARSYFIDFKEENLPNCDNPIGIEIGPIGNICAQSNNVLTGLCCALLVDYNIVKNINSFKGFDT